MKNIRSLRKASFLLLLLFSVMHTTIAQDSKEEKKAKKEAEIKQLIDSQNFVFKAQTALPMGARSRQLSPEYDLQVSKQAIISYLPYYGRAYSYTPGTSGGLEFTSKDFEYGIAENKKGDGWDIVIKPKDTKQARELLLSAFKNGSANLQVSSNDKQNISYYGYITANKTKK